MCICWTQSLSNCLIWNFTLCCASSEDVRVLLPLFMRNIPTGKICVCFYSVNCEIPQCQLYWHLTVSMEVGKNMKRYLWRNETHADITFFSFQHCILEDQGVTSLKLWGETILNIKLHVQKQNKNKQRLKIHYLFNLLRIFLKVDFHKNILKRRKYVDYKKQWHETRNFHEKKVMYQKESYAAVLKKSMSKLK